MQKKKYLKIKSVSTGIRYIDNLNEYTMQIMLDMLKDSEIEDGYELTVVEMTEEEFCNLPEFEGF